MALGLTDTMPFGKFKGEQIEDLIYDEPSYMTWLVEEEVTEFEQEVTDIMVERKMI